MDLLNLNIEVDVKYAINNGFCVSTQEHIGWRNQSRKLVVVSTDGEFHYAGDGMVSFSYINF